MHWYVVPEHITVISLYNINWLIFLIIETLFVVCTVRTKSLNIHYIGLLVLLFKVFMNDCFELSLFGSWNTTCVLGPSFLFSTLFSINILLFLGLSSRGPKLIPSPVHMEFSLSKVLRKQELSLWVHWFFAASTFVPNLHIYSHLSLTLCNLSS